MPSSKSYVRQGAAEPYTARRRCSERGEGPRKTERGGTASKLTADGRYVTGSSSQQGVRGGVERVVDNAEPKQAKEESCVDATECGLGYTDATAVRRTLPSWQRLAALGIVASSWMLPG